jgi:hypothetical protein
LFEIQICAEKEIFKSTNSDHNDIFGDKQRANVGSYGLINIKVKQAFLSHSQALSEFKPSFLGTEF